MVIIIITGDNNGENPITPEIGIWRIRQKRYFSEKKMRTKFCQARPEWQQQQVEPKGLLFININSFNNEKKMRCVLEGTFDLFGGATPVKDRSSHLENYHQFVSLEPTIGHSVLYVESNE
jgi:hypothetical protein